MLSAHRRFPSSLPHKESIRFRNSSFCFKLTSCENRVPKCKYSNKCYLKLVFLAVDALSIHQFTSKASSHDFLLHDSEVNETNHNSSGNEKHSECSVCPYSLRNVQSSHLELFKSLLSLWSCFLCQLYPSTWFNRDVDFIIFNKSANKPMITRV